MATIPTSLVPVPRLGVLRLALTGGIGLGAIFVLCWIGALFVAGPTHALIGLFTDAPMTSFAALWLGLCWAIAFGAVSGAVIAVVYNLVAFADPRD